MMNRRHIQGFAVVLHVLTGKLIAGFTFSADRLHNSHPGPDFVFPDRIVIQSRRGDRISPGAENPFRRRIDAGMIRGVIMGIQRFFSIAGKDILPDHFRGPYSFKHALWSCKN